MKLLTLLSLATLSTAIVIPDEQMVEQSFDVQHEKASESIFESLPKAKDVWSNVEESLKDAVTFSENAIDKAINAASEQFSNPKAAHQCHTSMEAFDMEAWLNSAVQMSVVGEQAPSWFEQDERPKHPKHGKHHHSPNKTVYELIAGSKYTTKLTELINKFPDLVETLNGTAANYTVFAPTDKAFEKLPKDHKKPSDEVIKKVLAYHVSPDFYPAGKVLASHTIPTTLGEEALGGEPQRLRLSLSLRGLAVNFYSKIVAVNIFGTNGVIHGVDSLLLPPPPALKIIELLPTEFSTLRLALTITGLSELIAESHHEGGTFFVPSNFAFKKLGPKINAFLFSSHGEKYLKALLQYHIVANQTLYSDAFYKSTDVAVDDFPKGRFHVDLPTLLKGKDLSVDILRFGGYITIKINGFNNIAVQDGIAKDGVMHLVSSVLIPPKSPKGAAYAGEELSVEELKARLDEYVQEDAVYEL
jgi:uncharacterized surface protein with fasciclin (FAS1) repeats